MNDLGIRVPVTEQVGLGVTLEWRHDRRPPADLRRDDLSFRTGVEVNLR